MSADIFWSILMFGSYYVVVIVISAVILRAVFKVPTVIANMLEQTRLLKEISETQLQILKNQQEHKDNSN